MRNVRDATNNRSEAMGKEPILKLLWRFAGPAILASETSALYNLLDAVWCGRLGPEAIAALSVAHPLMHIYMAVGAGIAVGASSLISRTLGAGKKEEVNRIVCCSISFFFILGGIMTIIGLTNLEALLRLFGARNSVLTFAYSYMFVETSSIVLIFFLGVLVELVRVGGSPKFAGVGTIIASIMDLIWSPILVFGLGPFPSYGIVGAALGTVVGRACGVSVLLAYLVLGKSIYQFKASYFMPKLKTLTGIYSIGLSQTLRAGSSSISLGIANNIAASFGVIPLAVLGVADRVQMVVFSVFGGISQGILPLVGYNFGAQKKDRVGEIVVKAATISLAWGALCCLVVTLIPTLILSPFGTDPDFIAGGIPAIRLFAVGFLALGVQSNLGSFFQGIGKAIPALIVSSSSQLIFLVPCLLTIPAAFGLIGLYAAYPTASFLALTLSVTWTAVTFRRLKIPFPLLIGKSKTIVERIE
jgi:putative MATE family efflux protein